MESASLKFQKQLCPYCAKEVPRHHLPLHMDLCHDTVALAVRSTDLDDSEERGESSSVSATLQRQHSATLSHVSETTTSEMVSPPTPDTVSPEQREAYGEAAVDLLNRHEIFYEEGLMRHLAEHHPLIEPAHRFPLMIGATTGAQLAAKLHVFTQCAQYSPRGTCPKKVADNAACALSYWNFGMRIGTNPTVSVFQGPGSFFDEEEEPVCEHAATQRQATSTRTKMLLPKIAVPVSFEQVNRDFPEDLSDDERDERPLTIDTRPNEEQPVVISTSTPTTSAIVSVTSGEAAPELKKSAVTTSSVTHNPALLKPLSNTRAATRRARRDEQP